MNTTRNDTRSLQLTIKDEESEWEVRGKQKQRNRAWAKYTLYDDFRFCLFCARRIDRGDRVDELGCERGEWHHLVRQRFFPAPYLIGEDQPYSLEGHKSRHHLSNVVLTCRACHGEWENWPNGRPHLMSWLFKDVTGAEIPLWIPFPARSNPYQYPNWAHVQRIAELRNDCRCTVCGHEQRPDASFDVYHDDRIAFTYTGKDVRAVHVIPPTEEPGLAHSQSNIVLLCLKCLFGDRIDNLELVGWKDRDTDDWVEKFAPDLDDYL